MGRTIDAPLFPLPNVLLYPGAILPLHIFEPRYVKMVEDMMRKNQRQLVMSVFRPQWEGEYFEQPPVHETGGIGEMLRCGPEEGGRYNILVQGTSRVRIREELMCDTQYRQVRVEPLNELPLDDDEVAASLRYQLQEALINFADGSLMLDLNADVSYLSDVLLVALPIKMEERQALFSLQQTRERAEHVLEAYRRTADDRRRFRDADRHKDRAPWN